MSYSKSAIAIAKAVEESHNIALYIDEVSPRILVEHGPGGGRWVKCWMWVPEAEHRFLSGRTAEREKRWYARSQPVGRSPAKQGNAWDAERVHAAQRRNVLRAGKKAASRAGGAEDGRSEALQAAANRRAVSAKQVKA